MDAIRSTRIAHLRDEYNIMVERLHRWCLINSGTGHLDGLARMHQTLRNEFAPLADCVETLDVSPVASIDMNGEITSIRTGQGLLLRKRPELSRRVLLMGHMDTVFAANHPFQSLRQLDDLTLNGPGVADMKGGLVVIWHALQAFETTRHASTLGWDLLLNADEEIGSPASAPIMDRIAPDYQAALVYEPSMDREGTFAKNRRGSGKLTLVARGKAAHVGRAFNEGRNAISYLAEVIVRIHALNGKRDGVTINVGRVAGGEALNVVPDTAVVKLDVRIADEKDEIWVMQHLQAIQDDLRRDGYELSRHGGFSRPVKCVDARTTRLFERIRAISYELGLPCQWKDSGGCCDGNNLARHGLPVIDTLGVRGGNIHSDQEFILLDSLVERATLSALLLNDLAEGGLEELHK